MTELALPDERSAEVAATDAEPFEPAPSELLLWVQEARQAALVATSLAKTSFVPASLRGKPEDITAAILAGQELGLKPMATLRSMDVIQGTPALRAHAMRGLVQSHGHQVELVESDDNHCIMRGRRTRFDAWQTVVWDLKRAQGLGLTSKDQWRKQPRTMLIARATGEICRLVAADALYAMPYAQEELRDGDQRADADEAPAVAYTPVTAADLADEPMDAPPAVEGAVDDWPPVAGGEA